MRYALYAVVLVLPVGALAWLSLPGRPVFLFLAILIAGLGVAAIRFPAAWSEARRFDADDADLLDGAREALRVMGVRWREASAGALSASVSPGWRSYGERMNVHVMDGLVECDSRCVYGLGDWGKNRQNVTEFFGALERAVGGFGSVAVTWKSGTMSPLDDAKRRLAFWKRVRWGTWAAVAVSVLVLGVQMLRGRIAPDTLGIPDIVFGLALVAVFPSLVIGNRLQRARAAVQQAEEAAFS
ncbi:MAG: hypothetical protein KDB73_05055 [Planctomycetes bacterium]|nr:hypothetical protein [Planctomycetota bacterium]